MNHPHTTNPNTLLPSRIPLQPTSELSPPTILQPSNFRTELLLLNQQKRSNESSHQSSLAGNSSNQAVNALSSPHTGNPSNQQASTSLDAAQSSGDSPNQQAPTSLNVPESSPHAGNASNTSIIEPQHQSAIEDHSIIRPDSRDHDAVIDAPEEPVTITRQRKAKRQRALELLPWPSIARGRDAFFAWWNEEMEAGHLRSDVGNKWEFVFCEQFLSGNRSLREGDEKDVLEARKWLGKAIISEIARQEVSGQGGHRYNIEYEDPVWVKYSDDVTRQLRSAMSASEARRRRGWVNCSGWVVHRVLRKTFGGYLCSNKDESNHPFWLPKEDEEATRVWEEQGKTGYQDPDKASKGAKRNWNQFSG